MVLAETQHLDGPRNTVVRLLRGIQHERGGVFLQPLYAWVPLGCRSSGMAGRHEADQRGLAAAVQEQARAALSREADQFLEPAQHREFEVGGRLISPDAVGVERGCQQGPEDGHRVRAAGDPAEAAWVPNAKGGVRLDAFLEERNDLLGPHPMLWQRQQLECLPGLRWDGTVGRTEPHLVQMPRNEVDEGIAQVTKFLLLRHGGKGRFDWRVVLRV